MRKVELGATGIASSRLGFGTSRLHYRAHAYRQRLLAAAADAGINHFDTAPAYGDGIAERELGTFLRGRRNGLTVVTKYGLPPDALIDAVPLIATPLITIRAIARRAGLWHQPRPRLTVTGLRKSVEASLRRLRTDRIDLLLLHEPDARRLADADELCDEFARLRTRGLIRAHGLAGGWSGLVTTLARCSALGEVLQTDEQGWPAATLPHIVYGAVRSGPQSFGSTLDVGARAVEQALRQALARRPQGVVLVSTTRVENLAELARIAAEEAA